MTKSSPARCCARRCAWLLLFTLLLPVGLCAQAYTSVVVFGDSLTDTGNLAHLTQSTYGVAARVPSPIANYTNGRFTDGVDTFPYARNFFGVWLEQLAATFPAKPAIANSLDGGTNYAYGFATTNTGTSNFSYGPGNALSVNVPNMGQQLATYLATSPTITNKTLFVVWGGANDLLNATSSADIAAAATREVTLVQQLIAAGATDFIVPNLPPLGAVPRLNQSMTTSVPATQAAVGFNQALAAGLATLPAANPGKTLHIYRLDIFSLFQSILNAPSAVGLANITASSQSNVAVNPDTYLFWDDLHPTTAGHHLIALAASTLLGTPVTTTTALTSSVANANLGAAVTLTATVTSSSGTAPVGTVTFTDGTTVLSTSYITASSAATATATYSTSSLTAGTHSITATFTGINGYSNSTATLSQQVTAPALQSAVMPASLTVLHGNATSGTVTLTAVGGYTGTATIACGTVPAHVTCTPSPASLTLTATNTTALSYILISTVDTTKTSLDRVLPLSDVGSVLACLLLPGLGLFGSPAFRRVRRSHPRLLGFLLLIAMGSLLGLGGCSSSPAAAATGTYTIPVTITSSGTTNTLNLTLIVQ